jgi:hypothetical protein
MKQIIYSIFDSASGIFSPPFYERAEGQAIRNVMAAQEDPNSSLHRNSEDYHLMRLGTFEDTSCAFELEVAPVKVYSLGSTNLNKSSENEIGNETPIQQST